MNYSTGNSWDPKVIDNCAQCEGKTCTVCHRHSKPRGKCDDCPPEKPRATPSK